MIKSDESTDPRSEYVIVSAALQTARQVKPPDAKSRASFLVGMKT